MSNLSKAQILDLMRRQIAAKKSVPVVPLGAYTDELPMPLMPGQRGHGYQRDSHTEAMRRGAQS